MKLRNVRRLSCDLHAYRSRSILALAIFLASATPAFGQIDPIAGPIGAASDASKSAQKGSSGDVVLLLDDGNDAPDGHLGFGDGRAYIWGNLFTVGSDVTRLTSVRWWMRTQEAADPDVVISMFNESTTERITDLFPTVSPSPEGRWYEVSLPSIEMKAGELFSVIIGASGAIPFPAGYDADAAVTGSSYFSDDGENYINLASVAGYENAAYLIRVHASTGVEPLPDLVVSDVTPPAEAFSGQPVEISWVVENTGEALTTAPEWKDNLYLSADNVLNFLEDALLGSIPNGSYLEPGQGYAGRAVVTLPQGISGAFYVFVITDRNERQRESDEQNNTGQSAGLMQVRLTPPPDLQVTSHSAPRESFSGQTVDVSWTVSNAGITTTNAAAWNDAIFLSADDVFDLDADRLLQTFSHSGTLPPGASYVQAVRVRLPDAVFGPHHLLFVADYGDQIFEHVGEDNNAVASDELNISLAPPPDLVVTSVTAPQTGGSGLNVTIEWSVQNQGAGAPFESGWSDRVYLSEMPELDAEEAVVLATVPHAGVVTAGESYSVSKDVKLPDGISGAYYLFVVTDWNGEVFEYPAAFEANNSARATDPLNIQLSPWPDLQVQSVDVPSTFTAGERVHIEFTVSNSGQGEAMSPNWRDLIYISPSATFDNAARHIATLSHSGPLAVGESYTASLDITASHDLSGTQYVFVKTNSDGLVYEHTDEGNNVGGSGAVSVAAYPPIDLVTDNLTAPSAGSSGQTIDLEWTVRNAGMGATIEQNWFDEIFLSADDALGPEDVLLKKVSRSGGLGASESYERTQEIILPHGIEGDFQLILENRLADSDASNNAFGAPISITLSPSPDLLISDFEVSTGAVAGQPVTIGWTVTNTGEGPTLASKWYDSVFLSQDGVADASDVRLSTHTHEGAIAAGASYSATEEIVLPLFMSGDLFVIVRADDRNDVYEGGVETNNTDFAAARVVLPPPSDLVPTSVEGPAAAAPGELVTLAWTIRNDGANPASGTMHDALYVSADAIWTVDDPVIGILTRGVNLQPGAEMLVSYQADLSKAFRADAEGNLTEELPGISPGEYHVIVRTDIRNNIRESSDANNVLASSSLMDVGMPSLMPGVPVVTTLVQGQERFYRIDLPGRATLRVLLDSDADDASNELFVAHGSVPTRSRFDARNRSAFQADQELLLPKTVDGTHFLAIRSELAPSSGQNVTILADTVSFELTRVTPSEGGDVGSVTLSIEGARLDSFTTVVLRPAGSSGGDIRPTWFRLANPGLIYATFDLREAAAGSYDLAAVSRPFSFDADTTTFEWFMAVDSVETMLPSAFRVVEGGGGRLEARLRLPESARLGNDFPVVLEVANLGNTDLPSPLLTIVSPNQTPLSTTRPIIGSGLNRVGVMVLAPEGRRDVLAPGQRTSAKLYARASQLPGSLFWLQEDADPRIGPAEFQTYFERFKPEEDWESAWQEFQVIVGSTIEDFEAALRRAALRRNPGFLERDHFFGRELIQDLVAEAWGRAQGKAYVHFGETSAAPILPGSLISDKNSGEAGSTLDIRRASFGDLYKALGDTVSHCDECVLSNFDLALAATQAEAAATVFFGTSWPYAGELLIKFLEGNGDGMHYSDGDELVSDLMSETVVQLKLNDLRVDIQNEVRKGGYLAGMACGTSKTLSLSDVFASNPEMEKVHFDFNGQGAGLALGLGNINGRVSGSVTVTKSCTCSGCCESVDISSDLRMNLEDVFDFCPATADRSNPMRAYVTFLVEQLEVCGWGKDVPVSVGFALPPISSSIGCKNAGGTEGEPECCKDPRPGNENFCSPADEDNSDGCGECPPEPEFAPMVTSGSGGPTSSGNVPSVASCDPNDMLGPAGFGDDKWVSASQVLPYTIRFENDPLLATAAAQVVTVSHELDDTVDPRSFRLGSFGFGAFQFDVPDNTAFFSQRLDVRDSLGVYVDATAGIDVAANEAFWVFRTIDPATGTAPTDPRAGFLAVNDTLVHNGEGFVTYSIRPIPSARTGDLIDVEASIFFDQNAPIDTPPLFNTVDADAPVSTLSYTASDEAGFHLTFEGEDEGSGVRDFALYVSTDGGPFVLHSSGITESSTVFVQEEGHRYRAFTIASDNAGNIEAMKSHGQSIVVRTEEGLELPESFALHPNFPNPFNPATTVPFDLPVAADVELTIYNVLGQRLTQVDLGRLNAGRHQQRIDLSAFASGVYFYEFAAHGEKEVLFREVRRLVMIK